MGEVKSKNCNGTDIKKSHNIKELPSQEYLKTRFDYNPESGDFIWKENDDFKYSINYKLVGKSAGTINKTTGYKDMTVDYNRYSVHRLIWKLYYGSKYYNTKEEAAYGRELKYRELIGEELYDNSDRYDLLKDLEEKVKLIKNI